MRDGTSGWRYRFCDTLALDHCRFSKSIPILTLSALRLRRGERAIWQRRYWEHLIRDEWDFAAHMGYVHINPLKHGLVKQVADWPFSTFHRLVDQGVYPTDWQAG